MTTKKPTFDDATQAVLQHVNERHWDTIPARGIAISMSLEANELLEHYQWQEEPVGDIDELSDELADVLIYAIQFAKHYDIDISEAIVKKLAKSAKKYPVEKFATTDPKQRSKNWREIKKNHKKDTVL